MTPLPRLDVPTRDGMWTLYSQYYAGTSRQTFERDLSQKDHVIVMRDARDGTLQGFSTLVTHDHVLHGQRFLAVFSGDTVIARAYWGQRTLHTLFTAHVLKTKLSHPLLPVYWFLITKGFRTYLLLSRYFPEYWPRHEMPTPPFQQAVMDHLASTMFGDHYSATRGVIDAPPDGGHLKEDVAPMDEEALKAPDVRFFSERNPGHARGDELVCLGRVDARFAAAFTKKIARHLMRI